MSFLLPSNQMTPADPAAQPTRRRGAGARRFGIHLSLFLAFGAVAGVALVWPQWLAYDGARIALEIQKERADEMNERLTLLRALNDKLRDWQQEGRKAFLETEIARYPLLAHAVAQRNQTAIRKVELIGRPSARWQSFALQTGAWTASETDAAGEVEPRMVRVVVEGNFASVYATFASLCQQQQLFVPDRWSVAPMTGGGPTYRGQVRGEVVATVFVVRERKPDAPVQPATPPPAAPRQSTGTVALNAPAGGMR